MRVSPHLSPLTPRLNVMKCPFCGAIDTQVIDSRVNEEGDSIRRRRRCPSCDKRFTTYETAELRMPQVVKQNGTREEFDRDKLRTSFMRALHKRPVPTEFVDEAIERIAQKVLSLGEREDAVAPDRRNGDARAVQARQGGLHPLRLGLSQLPGRGGFPRRNPATWISKRP